MKGSQQSAVGSGQSAAKVRRTKDEGLWAKSFIVQRSAFIVAFLLVTCHSSLVTAARAATHVTATYDLGANPQIMTTVGGQPQYGLVFAQRNKSVTYNSVEYTSSVVKGYLNASGQLNDGAGNLWLDLIPNLGATPADSYYVVTINIQGRVHAEIWVLPDVGTVAAEAVRVTQPPGAGGSIFDLGTATGLLPIAKLGTPTPCTSLYFLRWTGTAWDCAAGGGAGSTPTGTGFVHVTAGVQDAAAKLVENADVHASAAIVESKLSLNFATHSNANDPTTDQKAALAGTSDAPSGTNKYVTDADPRNSDSRTPTAHDLVSATHTAAGLTAGQPLRATGVSGFDFGALDLANANAITGDLPDGNLSDNVSLLGSTISGSELGNPAVGTKGGVEAKTCGGTDKLSAIGTDGVPVCAADQVGGAGGGYDAVSGDSGSASKTATEGLQIKGTANELTSTAADGTPDTITFTLASQLNLSGKEILGGATPLKFEGGTDNNIYWKFSITDPTVADKTTTVPNADTVLPQSFSCTNQFATALSGTTGATTCTTATLAGAQFANQGTTTTVLHGNAAGNPSWAAVTSADTTGTFPPNAHAVLSASHGDTTAASAVRGDMIAAVGATPKWERVGHSSTSGGYWKWNGTDVVASTGAASGTGACGANSWASTLNADAAPTCTQPSFSNLSGSAAAGQVPNLESLNGTLDVPSGGTGAAPGADDQALVSDSTSAATWRSIPNCNTENMLTYDTSTNTFGCEADAGGAGGGDNISVNGTAATDADFDDVTPAAPANGFNVKWQKDSGTPNNVSAYLDTTSIGSTAFGSGSGFGWTFNAGATDPVLTFGSGLTSLTSSHLGIGATADANWYLYVEAANDTRGFKVANTLTPGTSSGAGILASTTSYPTSADQRLGYFAWGNQDSATVAAITGWSSAAHGAGSSPGYLQFETTPSGITRVARWQIRETGHFVAVSDNSLNIGADGSTRPANVYVGTLVKAPTVNATTGFQVAGAATTDRCLLGNGTNFVGSGSDCLTTDNSKTLTNKTLDVEGAGNNITTSSKVYMIAAGCDNASAAAAWDLPTSSAAGKACLGTGPRFGVLTFADAATSGAYTNFRLPSDWTGNVDLILLYTGDTSSANNIVWQPAESCVADGEDLLAASFTTTTGATGAGPTTAGQRKSLSFSSMTMTGCAAGETMFLRIQRLGSDGSDTYTGVAQLLAVEMTMRRQQ